MGYDEFSCLRKSYMRYIILKRKNGNEELFAPNRKIKGSFSEYTKNAVTTFKNVVFGYCRITFENEKSLRKGDGKVIRYKGKNALFIKMKTESCM